MSKSNKKEKNWDDDNNQNFKAYKTNKVRQQESDSDFFRCDVCGKYKDSWDESEYNNLCIDCLEEDA